MCTKTIEPAHRINKMPSFGGKKNIYASEAYKKSKDESVRQKLNEIVMAKKQLSIQMQHWERIKRITKDQKEIAEIDDKLHKMRMEFLNFGSTNF
ncbi:unknown protein [Spodoptera frugiperda multiple nucleopolyhedrovirus]|uniref:DUF919 n=1 Tax=Spodoptera frugiperda nuclear polyhedrosis virus TaxID=10455 RepID=A1YJC0_NPVSF|nr:hypothetical protein SFMNPV_gp130 [Spodoptera frugiperda multiple nucleopolyhedrovirus]ABM45840.1 unknown protein [Spodoptera frugiperda multiple nucleopolyhedrovirus]ACA02686.1 DUF919 [Spodoptera frugiperda multiple nucleopolyhedrovirus]ADV91362.1 hypothetical protein Sf130 [Spodoptera frugiperda multiple nucleopolyhedrovirus]AFH59073.1 hypothetical protein Sf130 [Spodoptera frugiperda multiple nucleopolyhedrovirus]QED40043.1 hypothetical protein [Spodoptera frugiperda multiple nucleopolyh